MTFGSIEVTIPDDIQAPIPPVRLSGSNNKGATIVVTWPTSYGHVSMAYLEANDASGSRLGDMWKPSGIDQDNGTATWRPTTAQLVRLLGTSGAYLALKLEDENGTILVTRRFAIVVEDPVITAASVESEGLLLDLRKSAATAAQAKQDAADAEATFDKAVRDGKTAMSEAIGDFNTKGDKAISDNTDRVTALIDGASIRATSHEVTPATAPSVTKTGSGTQATFDFALPRAPHVDATAEAASDGTAAVTASTDGNGDTTLHFSLPRGASIGTVTAHALEAGSEATASTTRDGNGDWTLDLGLPRGEQGPQGPAGGPKGDKGDKGDPGSDATVPIATAAEAGKVKPGNGLSVDTDGTLSTLIAAGMHVYKGSWQAPLGAHNGYKTELSPTPTDSDPAKIGDLIVLPDGRIGVIDYVDTANDNGYYGIGSYWKLVSETAVSAGITSVTAQNSAGEEKIIFTMPLKNGIFSAGMEQADSRDAVAVFTKEDGVSAQGDLTLKKIRLQCENRDKASTLTAILTAGKNLTIGTTGYGVVQVDVAAVTLSPGGNGIVDIAFNTPQTIHTLNDSSLFFIEIGFDLTASTSTQAAEIEKSAASLQTLGYDEPAIIARLADTGYTVSFDDAGKPTATPTAQVDPPETGGPTIGGLS